MKMTKHEVQLMQKNRTSRKCAVRSEFLFFNVSANWYLTHYFLLVISSKCDAIGPTLDHYSAGVKDESRQLVPC